jgi:hypothetical protein
MKPKYKPTEGEKDFLKNKYAFELLNIIGYSKVEGVEIPFEVLIQPGLFEKFTDKIKDLKKVFPSSKLTGLHSTAELKQVYPAINLLRQVLKECGYKLKPIVKSDGYENKRKKVKRSYLIVRV